VAFDESPLVEGLLYAGTDDGLIHVSEDGGANWTKYSSFPGIPDRTYVNMLRTSLHDENTIYAVFNNHKNGDFKPYVLKSADRGKTWTSITANLPERGSAYAIVQDHIKPELLFVGTEFGVFFTNDGGKEWTALKKGLPTIAVRDMEIQRRENDLVLATFGRSFYVLDDYSPLRELTPDLVKKPAHIFPAKDALLYVPDNRMGLSGKSFMGESHFTAENPEFGAAITYHLSEDFTTLKDVRRKAEKEQAKEGKDQVYPSLDELRAEDREEAPYLLFVVKDSQGNTVQKIRREGKKGMHRLHWDLRHASTAPVSLKEEKVGIFSSPDKGMLALPGTYTVEAYKSYKGAFDLLAGPVSFDVVPLDRQSLLAASREDVMAFQREIAELERSVKGTNTLYRENKEKLDYIKKAIEAYPGAPLEMMKEITALEDEMYEINMALNGDRTLSSREFETLPGINDRLGYASYASWWHTSSPTETARTQLSIAAETYPPVMEKTKRIAADIKALEARLSDLKVPYTPGRGEDWRED
jgi:hypothetical protein